MPAASFLSLAVTSTGISSCMLQLHPQQMLLLSMPPYEDPSNIGQLSVCYMHTASGLLIDSNQPAANNYACSPFGCHV